MKKRALAILAACLSLLMVLSACGGGGTDPTPAGTDPATSGGDVASEPVTITYCNFNSSGGNEETLQRMYEAFHEEYPNITVEIETIAMDDYFTQLQTRIVGGTAPDCFEMNIENFAAYAGMGALAPIEGVDLSGMDETALSAFTVDGVQYGLPGNFSNVVLVYNKDLFDQANLEYPTSDWTQEDVQKAAEAISALGDDIYGYYQPLTYNEFYKACAQFGGSLLNEDKTEFTINSPENVAAAQMMADRVLVTNVQPTAEQMGGMGRFVGIFFFVAVLFAGTTSIINLYETPVAFLQEQFKLKRLPSVIIIHVIGLVVALLIQPWTSQWMDMVSIYICPFGAALAGIMFFWVLKKKTALDAVNEGARKPIGAWFHPFGKWVYVPLCIVALIAGAALGGIG